jgi:hypothetical protein
MPIRESQSLASRRAASSASEPTRSPRCADPGQPSRLAPELGPFQLAPEPRAPWAAIRAGLQDHDAGSPCSATIRAPSAGASRRRQRGSSTRTRRGWSRRTRGSTTACEPASDVPRGEHVLSCGSLVALRGSSAWMQAFAPGPSAFVFATARRPCPSDTVVARLNAGVGACGLRGPWPARRNRTHRFRDEEPPRRTSLS